MVNKHCLNSIFSHSSDLVISHRFLRQAPLLKNLSFVNSSPAPPPVWTRPALVYSFLENCLSSLCGFVRYFNKSPSHRDAYGRTARVMLSVASKGLLRRSICSHFSLRSFLLRRQDDKTSSFKNFHSGLKLLINSSFFMRVHPLILFSRSMANLISLCNS